MAEMLSNGVPCIERLDWGRTDVIKPNGNGLTYKIGDYKSLKVAVKQFNQTEIATWAARMATQQLPNLSMATYLSNVERIFSTL